MVGYKACEAAVLSKFREYFKDILNEDRCVVGDIDRMFHAMLREDETFGCVLDYSGGSRQARAPFKEQVWVWSIIGIFFIRYKGDQLLIDEQLRDVIDKLAKVFEDDRRLGGVVSLVTLEEIRQPEAETVNDVPFYWLPFWIEVLDK